MNLILFESSELDRPLPRMDRRATHILEILRRQPGDTFDVGQVNGPRGKATLNAINPTELVLSFQWSGPAPLPESVTLLIGLPRPQTARDILRDATTLGVAAMHFVRTEKSDGNYARSTLWSSGEWRRHLISGAEQAFDTWIPEVTFDRTLRGALSMLPASSLRVALDNYEAPTRLSELSFSSTSACVLAIGGERGWTADDREVLRLHQFTFANLGSRVLRTETATVAALTLLRGKLGWM